MIGQKGLPATFGGIEHHVEQIGQRLAARGHNVTVYCRNSYGEVPESPYLGMELRAASTWGTKHLDAIVHSGVSTAMAMAARSDIVHYHALGPGLLAPAPRYLSRAKVVLTVHGLDHLRGKWGAGAQAVLGSAHWMSGHVPHEVVVVSRALREHYRREFGIDSTYIPNGVQTPLELAPRRIVDELGLVPGEYVLFVGRLVPEKAPDLLLRAFRHVAGDRRLVIVGDSSFSERYADQVRAMALADRRVQLTGFVFGDLLSELYRHAAVFVQPSRLEGLPLTLLEAASYGVPVVASDIAPHQEVLGPQSSPGRRLFADGDEHALARELSRALASGGQERTGACSLQREVLAEYQWEKAVDLLEGVYLSAAHRSQGAVARQHPWRRSAA
ncbi:MAG: glycosyltransferase family 4 protein [Dermatophilaceae bacterium]